MDPGFYLGLTREQRDAFKAASRRLDAEIKAKWNK